MSLRAIRLALWGVVLVAGAALAVQQWTGREKSAETFRPDFALQDGNGQTYTMADFRGKFSLVFFGFTNCPDVCPTTMSEVAQLMDDLGAKADGVQPLFISIDPERVNVSLERGGDLSTLAIAVELPGPEPVRRAS